MVSHKGISAAVVAVIMAGGVFGGVMFLQHSSSGGILSSHANISFTTEIQGVSTNANQTPLAIDGSFYNLTDITNFHSSVSGNGGLNSTFTVTAGNFLDGDYVEFAVTITNTGGAPLILNATNNNYTYSNYFVNTQGQYINSPNASLYGNGYQNVSSPMNYTGFGTAPTIQQELNLMSSSGWDINWVNWWGAASSNPIPHELKNGQSFTYDVFVGLGTQAAYNIPDQFVGINIPLVPAR